MGSILRGAFLCSLQTASGKSQDRQLAVNGLSTVVV